MFRFFYFSWNCKCGGKYTFSGKARHCESKKHKSFIEKKIKNYIINNN